MGLEPRDAVLQGQGCGDVTQLQLQRSLPHGHPGRDSLALGIDPLRGPLSAPTEGGSGPQAVQDSQMGGPDPFLFPRVRPGCAVGEGKFSSEPSSLLSSSMGWDRRGLHGDRGLTKCL